MTPPSTATAMQPDVSPEKTESHSDELLQLTDEQIRTWTLEQKDRWWLENVYRGDSPQLTVRSALTGMLLGGVLSLTNLYVGAKTGWTLGVGITSVILSFAMFKVLSRIGLSREMTVLENNAMQSVATSAGYMTMPLISSMSAYMMVTNAIVPMGATMAWLIVLAILGVLFAFPLKKRFINDEQLPFPEGRAAGVVMHALHTGGSAVGMFKAKILMVMSAIGALVTFLKSEALTQKLRVSFLHIPEYLDGWIYKFAHPSIMGVELRHITIRPDTDLVLMAAGGLMGIRTGLSLIAGAAVNYFVLVPWMIQRGDIVGKMKDGVMVYGFKDIIFWALWGGVAMMTTSSLVSFFSKPQVLLSAFKGLLRRGNQKRTDVLKHIELPMSVFVVGIPVLGVIVVWMGHALFGVNVWLGALAIPLVFVFSLIAVNSTGLTSITPSSALGKLTQLTYGAIAPGNITANIMTSGITAEVASNASNLLMDIKPGYMLGGKPRHQALGHILGIFAGGLAAIPVFYLLFLHNGPQNISNDQYPMPSATVWKAVAEVLTQGLSNLKPSAQVAAAVGALLGILLELVKLVTKGRFWLSAMAFALAFVLPFNNCLTMFFGSAVFWGAERIFRKPESLGHRVMVQNQEPVCAGVIAGGALTGIIVTIIETFVL